MLVRKTKLPTFLGYSGWNWICEPLIEPLKQPYLSLKMHKYSREKGRERVLIFESGEDMTQIPGGPCSPPCTGYLEKYSLGLLLHISEASPEFLCYLHADLDHVNKPWLSCKEAQFQLSFQHHRYKLWDLPSNETEDSKIQCDFLWVRIDIFCLGNITILYVLLTWVWLQK